MVVWAKGKLIEDLYPQNHEKIKEMSLNWAVDKKKQILLPKYLLFQLKFAEDSGYKELLDPYYKSISQGLQEWMKLPFEQNPNYPDQLIHKTVSGNLVRFTSESMIDMFLYMNRIPFRYECKLMLGKVIVKHYFC